MAAPSLTVQINGQGTVSGDQLNTYEQTCDNVVQLRAFVGVPGMQVYIRGYTAVNDGGQGPFYWNPTATGPDDSTNVIVPTGISMGAWIRLVLSPVFLAPLTINSSSALPVLMKFISTDAPANYKNWRVVLGDNQAGEGQYSMLRWQAADDSFTGDAGGSVNGAQSYMDVTRTNLPTQSGSPTPARGKRDTDAELIYKLDLIANVVCVPQKAGYGGANRGGIRMGNLWNMLTGDGMNGIVSDNQSGDLVLQTRSDQTTYGALRCIQFGGITTSITGAADNGSGLIRLTVGDTSQFTTGQIVYVSQVNGTVEANNNLYGAAGSYVSQGQEWPNPNAAQPQGWVITVIDGTNVDLQGSTFVNTFVSSPNAIMQDGATESFRLHTNRYFGIGPFNPYAPVGPTAMPDRLLTLWSTAVNGAGGVADTVLAHLKTGAIKAYIEFEDAGTTNKPTMGGNGDNLNFRTGASGTHLMTYDSSGQLTVAAGVAVSSTSAAVTRVKHATTSLDFGSISGGASADLTITVTGALVGDSVAPSLPAAPTAGIIYQMFVSATDTVTVRATNITGGAIDPAAQTFGAAVIGFT